MKYLTLAAALCAASPALAAPYAVDGDTLDLSGRRIRLAAVDAPELKQTCTRPAGTYPCGVAAKAALQALVDHGVTCTAEGSDRWGRTVAGCRNPAGEDIGALMVRQGWAVPYYKYGGERYTVQLRLAQAAGAGMHAGTYDDPASWRHARQGGLAASAPPDAGWSEGDHGSVPGLTGSIPTARGYEPRMAPPLPLVSLPPQPVLAPYPRTVNDAPPWLPAPPVDGAEQKIKQLEQHNRLLMLQFQQRIFEDALRLPRR